MICERCGEEITCGHGSHFDKYGIVMETLCNDCQREAEEE